VAKTARKTWTVSDTVRVADAVIANGGERFTDDQFPMAPRGAWLLAWLYRNDGVAHDKTALGYPISSPAHGISALDRAVARVYLAHDPRLAH
jgi:hypothetical protein